MPDLVKVCAEKTQKKLLKCFLLMYNIRSSVTSRSKITRDRLIYR